MHKYVHTYIHIHKNIYKYLNRYRGGDRVQRGEEGESEEIGSEVFITEASVSF